MLLKPVSLDVPLTTLARALYLLIAVLGVPHLFSPYAYAQSNVLKYLELRDIGATPAEILLSPDFQTIIEFEGLAVQSASSGRADQITVELNEQTIRLRANQDTVNTDLTVVAGGKTALFILHSDPTTNTPRRYVVRNSPPPPLQSLGYQGIEGKTDLSALSVGTKELPPGVTLNMTATMDNKGELALQYILRNDGEVAIVNEPSRLYILNEDIKLLHTLSRVPPAGSVNVIRPGQSEYGTVIVQSPPNGQLTFLWILVQLGPGGHYAATLDISELLESPRGTSATVGAPADPANTATPPATEAQTAPAPAEQTATPQTVLVDTSAVAQGAGVTLYEHNDFGGASVSLAGDGPISFYQADQGQFGAVPDNAVSSLIVSEGYSVLLCDVQATFPCQQYAPGSYPSLDANLNDIFSFAQVSVSSIMETATAEAIPANNLLLNSSFDNNDAPWWFYVAEDKGAKAEHTLVDGSYCVSTTKSGQELGNIAFGQNDLKLEAGGGYTLSFEARAEQVKGLNVRLNLNAEPWTSYFSQVFTADAGMQRFEFTLTAPETTDSAQLVFQLGGEPNNPTTVCLDNVTLVATTAAGTTAEQPNTEPTTNTPDLAGTYALAATHSGLCADVLRFSEDDGATVVQWTCNNEMNQRWTLEPQDDDYTVIAEHSSKCMDVSGVSTEDGAAVQQWSCHGGDNQLWSLKQVANGYQLVSKHSGKCLAVSDASAELGAGFIQWSCSGGEEASNDVFALTPTDPNPDVATSDPGTTDAPAVTATLGENLLANSAFDSDTSEPWNGFLAEGARGVMKVVEGEYCLNILNGGPNVWNVGLNQRNIPLEAERSYTLSFDAYADDPRQIEVKVGQGYEPWKAFFTQTIDLQEQKQTHSLSFTMPASSEENSSVEFFSGGQYATETPFRVCLDNVILTDTAPTNMTPTQQDGPTASSDQTQSILHDSFFDQASDSPWQTWLFSDEGASGSGTVDEGEYCFSVENGGSELWHVQLFQRGFLLEPNQEYTLSFEAYTDKPHRLHAKIGQGYEPWQAYQEQQFEIGTEKQTYTMPFSLETRESNSSAEFWLGGEFSNTPVTTCFDNIVITKGNMTAAQ